MSRTVCCIYFKSYLYRGIRNPLTYKWFFDNVCNYGNYVLNDDDDDEIKIYKTCVFWQLREDTPFLLAQAIRKTWNCTYFSRQRSEDRVSDAAYDGDGVHSTLS